MKRLITAILAVFAVASYAADTTVADPAPAVAEKTPDGPYPLENWAVQRAVRNVEVSPDGKRLALLKIPHRGGSPVLEVYEAADLTKKPFRMNADPMQIEFFNWVSDKHILFAARQQVRNVIGGFNQGVYRGKVNLLDVEKKEFKDFGIPDRTELVNRLPKEPYKVIVAVFSGGERGPKARRSIFRPAAYYELDLEKATKKLLLRGKVSLSRYSFDSDGNPWLARGFDERKREFVWFHRQLGTKNWKEIYRLHEDSFESFGVGGFDVDQREKIFVVANAGNDTRGLWSLDATTGNMTLIDRRNDVDVAYLLRGSHRWTDPDRVVGYAYATDRVHRQYFNKEAGATYEQLATIIPNARDFSITSRSRDGATLTVNNQGPRDPGTYYLLKDGRFTKVGSEMPVEAEKMADVEYITYKSRDGKDIHGYVTIPQGKPPFPLVVLPHGGPFVREYVSYDKWGQLLANNGYLVLQPQYRGSRGYGTNFYTSAFLTAEGGQGGGRMQDDKDDGALHLVKIGRADPKRMAMVGWSYGGYAAAVAASRTPQIYQCVVAGAAVFDPVHQVNYYREYMDGADEVEQVQMWGTSVSPIKEVAKVNVPMLILHGAVDQRVPVEHARKYTKALDEHDKDYKYIEWPNADHFSNTWSFDIELEFYTEVLDFLANDCGIGET